MIAYHISTSVRSMRRNPVLTALIVAAIAVGIGISVSLLTIHHIMAQNPIPHKSDRLYRVTLDSWGPLSPFDGSDPNKPPTQMTYLDATGLLQASGARHQTAMFETRLIMEPSDPDVIPFELRTRVTSGDFFTMFEVPFLFGAPWDSQVEAEELRVVVLTRAINDRLFGGIDSVGETLLLNGQTFTVQGVTDTFEPMPRYYDTINGPFQSVNEVFVPLSLAAPMDLWSFASTFNWKAERIVTHDDWLRSEACWMQYWAELGNDVEVEAYRAHLDSYAREQKRLGRFQRPLNNRIFDVEEWLAYRNVVAEGVKVLAALGFLFLGACMIASVALLVTKFNGRTVETSLRRALGANRLSVMGQHLTEVGLIGLGGGILGLGLARICLAWIESMITDAPAGMLRMDWEMVAAALVIAICSSLATGLLPALRSCMVPPANALNAQ